MIKYEINMLFSYLSVFHICVIT